jgi:glutamate-5-semialdehyde dehydrogenase
MNVKEYVVSVAKAAKKGGSILAYASTEAKNKVLKTLAVLIEKEKNAILEANKKDMEAGKAKGLNAALLDRLLLNESRIEGMIDGIKTVISIDDPVGYMEEQKTLPNGLDVGRIRCPLGTIGFIYESRPNATVEAAILTLKSGNAIVLRGGSEAFNSNTVLVGLIRKALKENALPEDAVCFFDRTDRECVNHMLKLNEYIDLIIPRGREEFVKMVVDLSAIPVIRHDQGVCTIYIAKDAKKEMAEAIAVNSKAQRPGVCNASENIIFDADFPYIKDVLQALYDHNVEIRGCEKICRIFKNAKTASADEWSKEYLDLIIGAKVVSDTDEAIDFINTYGSHHSDAIITESYSLSRQFLKRVDSAAVYVNASTRFTDGGEFGLGAEIGIATSKLHARGPMGLKELTTIKWIIMGDGQVRG